MYIYVCVYILGTLDINIYICVLRFLPKYFFSKVKLREWRARNNLIFRFCYYEFSKCQFYDNILYGFIFSVSFRNNAQNLAIADVQPVIWEVTVSWFATDN